MDTICKWYGVYRASNVSYINGIIGEYYKNLK